MANAARQLFIPNEKARKRGPFCVRYEKSLGSVSLCCHLPVLTALLPASDRQKCSWPPAANASHRISMPLDSRACRAALSNIMSNPHSFGRHCKYPLVIARSAATRQSMQFEFIDCHASLAMTAKDMDCHASLAMTTRPSSRGRQAVAIHEPSIRHRERSAAIQGFGTRSTQFARSEITISVR